MNILDLFGRKFVLLIKRIYNHGDWMCGSILKSIIFLSIFVLFITDANAFNSQQHLKKSEKRVIVKNKHITSKKQKILKTKHIVVKRRHTSVSLKLKKYKQPKHILLLTKKINIKQNFNKTVKKNKNIYQKSIKTHHIRSIVHINKIKQPIQLKLHLQPIKKHLIKKSHSIKRPTIIGNLNQHNSYYFIPTQLTFNIGSSWMSNNYRDLVVFNSDAEKLYIGNNAILTTAQMGVFFAWEKTMNDGLFIQIGPVLEALSQLKIKGLIWDEADPRFVNNQYLYNINAYRVAAEGKMKKDIGLVLLPYINTSIGLGINKASDYKSIPLDCSVVNEQPFVTNTASSFSYSFGVGLEMISSKHLQFGLGYQFTDWGQSQLGAAVDQYINAGIYLPHIYTNAILLNIIFY